MAKPDSEATGQVPGGAHNAQSGNTTLSALDQIRQAEAQVARQVADGYVAADVQRSKLEAEQEALLQEARELGRRDGHREREALLVRAHEESAALLLDAHHQADTIRQCGLLLIGSAIRSALNIILGFAGETEDA